MSKHKQPSKETGKEIVTTVEKKPALTLKESRQFILSNFKAEGNLARNLLRLANEPLPQVKVGDIGKGKVATEAAEELLQRAFLSMEAETHMGLIEGFGHRYGGMADELSSRIIKEYQCNTHAEKMLAETVVGAFMRYLDASRRFNNGLAANSDITANLTGFLAMMSKQMDRAHRQYLSALMTLKQLKAPNIEVNIKAKTAFVAQNQQINAPQQSNETIEPK